MSKKIIVAATAALAVALPAAAQAAKKPSPAVIARAIQPQYARTVYNRARLTGLHASGVRVSCHVAAGYTWNCFGTYNVTRGIRLYHYGVFIDAARVGHGLRWRTKGSVTLLSVTHR